LRFIEYGYFLPLAKVVQVNYTFITNSIKSGIS